MDSTSTGSCAVDYNASCRIFQCSQLVATEIRRTERNRSATDRRVVEDVLAKRVCSDRQRLTKMVAGEEDDQVAISTTRRNPAAEAVIALLGDSSDELGRYVASDLAYRAVVLVQHRDLAVVGLRYGRREVDRRRHVRR